MVAVSTTSRHNKMLAFISEMILNSNVIKSKAFYNKGWDSVKCPYASTFDFKTKMVICTFKKGVI